ncbi:carrier superfamily protein, partial [Cardiosporidium cionae]
MPTTILMNIPFGAVAVSVNELLKNILKVSHSTGSSSSKKKQAYMHNSDRLTDGPSPKAPSEGKLLRVSGATMPISAVLQYFFCAGVGGGVAGVISNPLDVIKTRLQTQDCEIQREHAFRELGNRSSISPIASMKY